MKKQEKEVLRYLEAKHRYAQMIQAGVAKSSGPLFRVVAVKGAVYSPGSTVDPNNPADPTNTKCLLADTAIVESDYRAWPKFEQGQGGTAKYNVKLYAESVKAFGSQLVSAGVN